MSAPLSHDPRSYEFQALVHELVRALKPEMRPGEPGLPSAERIRFRTNPSLGFPASEVAGVETLERPPGVEGESLTVVTVNFMGLCGTASPLPPHVAQEVLWEAQEPEGRRVLDFLDLFDHRMVSFVCRASEKYRYALRFEPGGRDEFSRRVLALAGLDSEELREAAGLPLEYLMRGLGALVASRRSASGLEAIVSAAFPGILVRVQGCIARRLPIPAEQRLRLSAPQDTHPRRGAITGLGFDTCLGASVVDASSAFRLTLGPMDHATYRRFLPGEPAFAELVKLTRLYVQDPLDFDVELRLAAAERPAVTLDPDAGQRLGQTTWLSPSDEHDGSTRLRVPSPRTEQRAVAA